MATIRPRSNAKIQQLLWYHDEASPKRGLVCEHLCSHRVSSSGMPAAQHPHNISRDWHCGTSRAELHCHGDYRHTNILPVTRSCQVATVVSLRTSNPTAQSHNWAADSEFKLRSGRNLNLEGWAQHRGEQIVAGVCGG